MCEKGKLGVTAWDIEHKYWTTFSEQPSVVSLEHRVEKN